MNPNMCICQYNRLYVYKNKEGKVKHKENIEKERNNVIDPEGHTTKYSHHTHLQEQNKNYNFLW